MSARPVLIIAAVLLFLVAAVGISALGPFTLIPLGLALWAVSGLVP